MKVRQLLADIFSVKINAKHDGYLDQFNRRLMTKVLLLCSIITLIDYFTDKVDCMVGDEKMSDSMTSSMCWVNGIYIYKELHEQPTYSKYIGIPTRLSMDHRHIINGDLCGPLSPYYFNRNHDPLCKQMTKKYYFHYQWMPFYLASISLLYFLPYIVYRRVNTDMMSLKLELKTYAGDSNALVRNYFSREVNSASQMRLRLVGNCLVKVLYLVSSLAVFYTTDFLLNGRYISYGRDYIAWSKVNASLVELAHKPGNLLLPSVGICEIQEALREWTNQHRIICEISPHILYQHILLVLWFFFIASILVSSLGLLLYLLSLLQRKLLSCLIRPIGGRSVQSSITQREIEYLEYIKEHNMAVYGEIIRALMQEKIEKPNFDKGIEI